jgi:uncharacterized damage-inducible protein DinB
MGKLELITHLYEYNQWATTQLLNTCDGLSEDQLGKERGASFASIRRSFAHIAAAEINWLQRWMVGQNQTPTVELQKMPDMDTVRASFLSSHLGLREFIAGLTEGRLDAPLTFRDSSGTEQTRPLWQLMMHVANHGTYHRGEIAMMLTGLGHSPGDIDFIFWAFEYHP